MNFIKEINSVPILGEYDVIVAGGGPAGIGAALAAARHGAKTLIVERFGCLGGMWTAGLVNPLFDYENKGGIVQEIVDHINALKMNSHSGSMYTLRSPNSQYTIRHTAHVWPFATAPLFRLDTHLPVPIR